MVEPIEPVLVSNHPRQLADSSKLVEQKMYAEASRCGSHTVEVQHLLLSLGLWVYELGKPIYRDLFGELSPADLRRKLPQPGEKGTVTADKTSAKVDEVFAKAKSLANGSNVSGQHLLLAFFELFGDDEPVKSLGLEITPDRIKADFDSW